MQWIKKADADNYLESIVEVVRKQVSDGKSLVQFRTALDELFGSPAIIFRFEGGAHFEIAPRGKKPIIIINKSHVDVGEKDIVVGDYVIGYL